MFKSARIKLTLWYLIIITFICVFFSFGMYKLSTDEFDRFSQAQKFRYERRLQFDKELIPPEVRMNFPEPVFDDELVTNLKNKVAISLFIIDLMIFLISGVLSYILAGLTLKPIKSMVDEQNRFISDASHELRTPLTALKSSMEVYLRDPNASLDDAKALIKDSITDVDVLDSLSTDLLQLAQYQKPNETITFDQLNSVDLINASISKIEPFAQKKHIELKMSVDSFDFSGNKYSLVDLIVLLLDNAIKYSSEGKTIYINIGKNDGFAELTVKDEGVGIDAKDIPYIFERFYRSDNSRTNAGVSGFGLGLSIANKIVKLHQGTIGVESELNKGSTFTVKIPIFRKGHTN